MKTDQVMVPRELLSDLADLASDAAEQHRQAMGSYRVQRQAVIDRLASDARTLLAQPAREAVAWQFFQDGKWWNGSETSKTHRRNTEEAGYPVRDLFAAPPAAPAQDVAGLVEALRDIVKHYPRADLSHVDYRVHARKCAEQALAAYKGDAV